MSKRWNGTSGPNPKSTGRVYSGGGMSGARISARMGRGRGVMRFDLGKAGLGDGLGKLGPVSGLGLLVLGGLAAWAWFGG
jgi:hypothetical protein